MTVKRIRGHGNFDRHAWIWNRADCLFVGHPPGRSDKLPICADQCWFWKTWPTWSMHFTRLLGYALFQLARNTASTADALAAWRQSATFGTAGMSPPFAGISSRDWILLLPNASDQCSGLLHFFLMQAARQYLHMELARCIGLRQVAAPMERVLELSRV